MSYLSEFIILSKLLHRSPGRLLLSRAHRSGQTMAPPVKTALTAAQILKHPEYPHVFWDLKPTQSGILKCGKGRGGPYNIAWELHGTGPRHILFIMGLGGIKSSWQRQTKDFGHIRSSEFSVLLVENIGSGGSDKPLTRYSTSSMARDIIEVLDHLSWTSQPRSLHAVGISMGGMIAQEIAYSRPELLASLMLVSTAARLVNTVGFFQNARQRVNMFLPKGMDGRITASKANLYTPQWLELPDESEHVVEAFPTNGDRFAAGDIAKRTNPKVFTKATFLLQGLAAGWHNKTSEQLQEIARKVGRQRICVIHGTDDRMITAPHGETLIDGLSKGAEADGGNAIRSRMWQGQGHVIPVECRKEFNDLMESVWDQGDKLNGETKQ